VTVRRIPGALALGLLASLLAHSVLYGSDHAMGGAYHDLLVQLATAGCSAFVLLFAALAWCGATRVADGSVLAARLAAKLPTPAALVASTGLWFALGERIEPQHAEAGLFLTLVVVAAIAVLLFALARWGVRSLARVVIAIARLPFAACSAHWIRCLEPVPVVHRSPQLRRRFARPPPIANARA
jgi:hypothetical protein